MSSTGTAASDAADRNARELIGGFFAPGGVAIIGAVDRNADPAALKRGYDDRYGDRWYLVNPKGGTIGDIRVYETVESLPEVPGLAIVNVGPPRVAGVIEECGKAGVKYALVFASGFSEVGPEGAALERAVGEAAQRYGVRVFGPNTNTNAFEKMPELDNRRGGKIALLTQSGHNGRPIVQGSEFGVAFSRWVPTGNELDLEVADFLEYFAGDPEVAVIAGYFEGFKNATQLRRALEAANAANKPVVALKMGSTEAGAAMASSHTGHMTGSDRVVDGLFRQYGVTRVHDLDELLDTAALFAKLPAGTGPNVALYSISGGSGTLMAEIADASGVPLAKLSAETQAKLHEHLPDYLTVSNPVDNGGNAVLNLPKETRLHLIRTIAADPSVDVLIVGLTGALGAFTDLFAEDIVSIIDDLGKPIIATWNSYKDDETGFRTLVDARVPMFRSFRNCFGALAAFNRYQQASKSFRVRVPLDVSKPAGVDAVLGSATGALPSDASRELIEAFGVPCAGEAVVTSADEAARVAEGFGFPVVMKIASADFPHKSDLGLVLLGVADADAVAAGYDTLVARAKAAKADAAIDGVLVQEQVVGGVEMIVGLTQDPVFGPAVMVGTGGIFAEILDDVAVRPLPIDRDDAVAMVESLRGVKILDGARGAPPADKGALVDVIMSVAALATACGDRVRELDINPVLVKPSGVRAVDSLAVLG
jgi:acyl-CoA synthetase (NDP forming)